MSEHEKSICSEPFQQPAFKRRRWLRAILDHIRESFDLKAQKERLELIVGTESPAFRAFTEAVDEHARQIVELEEKIAQSFAAEADPETPVTEEPKPEVSPP